MQTFARDRLLGLQFLTPRLIRAVYSDSLGNVLPELLQDVDLQTRMVYGSVSQPPGRGPVPGRERP